MMLAIADYLAESRARTIALGAASNKFTGQGSDDSLSLAVSFIQYINVKEKGIMLVNERLSGYAIHNDLHSFFYSHFHLLYKSYENKIICHCFQLSCTALSIILQ